MEFRYRAHEAQQEDLHSPPDSGDGAAHLTTQQARNRALLSYGKDIDGERAAIAMQLQQNMDFALIEKIVRNTVTKMLIEEQVRRQMALQSVQGNAGGGGRQVMDFGADGLLPTPLNDAVDFGEFNDQPSPQQLGNTFYGNAMHRQNKTNVNYTKRNPNSFKQEMNMQPKAAANFTNKPILPLPNQMKQDPSAFEHADQNAFAPHEGKHGNAKLSGFKRKPEEEGELEEDEEEEQRILEEHIQQQQPRGVYMGNQMHGGTGRGHAGAGRGRGGGGQRGGGGRLGHVRYTNTENLEVEHGAQIGDHGMLNHGGGIQGAGRGGGRGFGSGGRGRSSGGGRAQFGGRDGGRGGGGGRFQKGAPHITSGANQMQLGVNLGLGRM